MLKKMLRISDHNTGAQTNNYKQENSEYYPQEKVSFICHIKH